MIAFIGTVQVNIIHKRRLFVTLQIKEHNAVVVLLLLHFPVKLSVEPCVGL
jgi:hypothetical protein